MISEMINDKSILVTGGTGSFGHAFVRTCLERFQPRKLIVFSRNELKQHERALRGAGIFIHAAQKCPMRITNRRMTHF